MRFPAISKLEKLTEIIPVVARIMQAEGPRVLHRRIGKLPVVLGCHFR